MSDSSSTPSVSIADATTETFEQLVLERSYERPVVVDFWATWCQPCKQLAPILQDAADKYRDDVDVVKVEVQDNRQLSVDHRVNGVPSVKAFRNGAVIGEFSGAQPASQVDKFFQQLLPSLQDRLTSQAHAAASPQEASRLFTEALSVQPDHPGAAVGLADLLVEAEEREAAVTVLKAAVPTPDVQRRLAQLNLLLGGQQELDELEARVAAGDDAARVVLGTQLASIGDYNAAITQLLNAAANPETRPAARDALLELFTALGPDDPRVPPARKRLTSLLF